MALPLIVWVSNIEGNYEVVIITFYIEQMSLVLSCIVLIWGITRLVRLAQDFSDMLVKKVLILLHIVAYMFIILVNISQTAATYKGGLRAFQISTICLLAVYSVCDLIFGLIVNTILTKIIAADNQSSLSITSSLIYSGSVLTRQASEESFDSGNSAKS